MRLPWYRLMYSSGGVALASDGAVVAAVGGGGGVNYANTAEPDGSEAC